MRQFFLLVLATVFMSTTTNAETRRIAITFDDAPLGDGPFLTGEKRGAQLLSGLKNASVEQAAFFVTTKNIRGKEDKARLNAYAAEGHVIANHSHSHSWLRKTKPSKYLRDIDRAEKHLEGYEYRRPWFRFPYLDEGPDEERRDAVRAGLAKRGLKNGYVTVDNYDWYMNRLAKDAVAAGHCIAMDGLRELYVETILDAASFYDGVAVNYLGRQPAHVLLLHENDLAGMFIEDLIAALRRDNWEIITADDAYQDAIADVNPETLFNGQGRVAAIADASGAPRRALVSEREDETILARLFVLHAIIPCGDDQ